MSIDRRIVSILYFNDININKVEKFLGEKDNYYEVIVDGEIKKLKIPGKEYTNLNQIDSQNTQNIEEQYIEELISEYVEDIKFHDKTVLIDFDNNGEKGIEGVDGINEIEETITEEQINDENTESVDVDVDVEKNDKEVGLENDNLDFEDSLKSSEIENTKIEKTIKKSTKTTTKKSKKTNKDIQNDIDDFINLI